MPKNSIILIPAALFAALLATGCVSKSKLDQVAAELAACDQARAEAEARATSWEQRFDRESSRWSELEASVSEALPRAMSEFHQEKQRILGLVPEQVQSEVAAYLEDYFTTVMKGFEILSDDNAEIRLELQATRKALEAVGSDTRSIGSAIDEALADERGQREAAAAQLAELSRHLAEVVDQVVAFDQKRINCKTCPERLKLNRKEREAILGFHAELMSDLSDLQSAAFRPDRDLSADGGLPDA